MQRRTKTVDGFETTLGVDHIPHVRVKQAGLFDVR